MHICVHINNTSIKNFFCTDYNLDPYIVLACWVSRYVSFLPSCQPTMGIPTDSSKMERNYYDENYPSSITSLTVSPPDFQIVVNLMNNTFQFAMKNDIFCRRDTAVLLTLDGWYGGVFVVISFKLIENWKTHWQWHTNGYGHCCSIKWVVHYFWWSKIMLRWWCCLGFQLSGIFRRRWCCLRWFLGWWCYFLWRLLWNGKILGWWYCC